jgi:hypothetical protein
MKKRLFAKTAPLVLGLGLLASGTLPGCGSEDDIASLEQQVTVQKSAQINQTDIDGLVNSVKLKNCTFVIASGTGTFTPSSELSQVLYGDPNGSAHKVTFAVPPLTSGSASIEIKNLEAEMANTGLTLSGGNATLKIGFKGLLKVSVTVPVFGKLPADIQIRSSSISAVMTYDAAAERVRVSSVTSKIDHVTKNCGGSGWCNGIVDGILKSNLSTWIDAPAKDALSKALDKDSITQDLNDVLVAFYNMKDPATPAWTGVPHTLSLASGAFSFKVERNTP